MSDVIISGHSNFISYQNTTSYPGTCMYGYVRHSGIQIFYLSTRYPRTEHAAAAQLLRRGLRN